MSSLGNVVMSPLNLFKRKNSTNHHFIHDGDLPGSIIVATRSPDWSEGRRGVSNPSVEVKVVQRLDYLKHPVSPLPPRLASIGKRATEPITSNRLHEQKEVQEANDEALTSERARTLSKSQPNSPMRPCFPTRRLSLPITERSFSDHALSIEEDDVFDEDEEEEAVPLKEAFEYKPYTRNDAEMQFPTPPITPIATQNRQWHQELAISTPTPGNHFPSFPSDLDDEEDDMYIDDADFVFDDDLINEANAISAEYGDDYDKLSEERSINPPLSRNTSINLSPIEEDVRSQISERLFPHKPPAINTASEFLAISSASGSQGSSPISESGLRTPRRRRGANFRGSPSQTQPSSLFGAGDEGRSTGDDVVAYYQNDEGMWIKEHRKKKQEPDDCSIEGEKEGAWEVIEREVLEPGVI